MRTSNGCAAGRPRSARSRGPRPSCCSLPQASWPNRLAGQRLALGQVHSHLLAAMPPGVFPGVDQTDVLTFLERHSDA